MLQATFRGTQRCLYRIVAHYITNEHKLFTSFQSTDVHSQSMFCSPGSLTTQKQRSSTFQTDVEGQRGERKHESNRREEASKCLLIKVQSWPRDLSFCWRLIISNNCCAKRVSWWISCPIIIDHAASVATHDSPPLYSSYKMFLDRCHGPQTPYQRGVAMDVTCMNVKWVLAERMISLNE